MKIKTIITLSIIGIISSLYINEKLGNHALQEQLTQQKQTLTQQLGNCRLDNYSHKKFFKEYLAKKRNELNKLSHKFTEEEKEWLETYWEASQADKEDTFVKKQLIRAGNNLSKKVSEKELNEILSRRKEIIELEKQLIRFRKTKN